MKIIATSFALFLHYARAADLNAAFDIEKESFRSAINDIQPECVKPVSSYMKCMSIPDDIDETFFMNHPDIPSGTSLGMLKGTPKYENEKGMIEAVRGAISRDSTSKTGYNLISYEYTSEDGKTPILATSVVKDFGVASDEDEVLDIWNTYTSAQITFGLQLLYDFREVPFSDDMSIPDFPANFPPLDGGFYDIVITPDTIKYTLKDNRSASSLIFPPGTFDKYYIIFPGKVASVSLISSDDIVPTVSIVEDGTVETTVDLFHTGLQFPSVLGDNTIEVAIGPGTDLTNLGQVIEITYSLEDVKSPDYVCASSPLLECTLPVVKSLY